MPNFTGQLKGSSTSQTIVSINDKPDHVLMLSVNHSHQTCSDPHFNNIRQSSWGTADLTRGAGKQHGYFVAEHSNGDQSCGTYECSVNTVNGQLTMEGRWQYTHGTGQFEGIQGNGTFKGRQLSPSTSEITFDGNYQLKSGTRAA